MIKKYFSDNLKFDFSSGIVVFLVAVPLCLGIALASGAPLFSGLIAGIVGGIVIGIFSNSQLSVSGPAAGLTAVVLASITKLGAFETFLMAVVLAGAMQMILGFLKAGSIANYFPSNVIKGMLTAIGIIIILKQLPHAFGYDKDSEGDFSFLQIDGNNTFSTLLQPILHIDLGAIIIALVGISLMLLWESKFIPKVFKILPGGLMAVLSGIALNILFDNLDPILELKKEHLVNIPVAHNFNEFVGLFTLPDFTQITNPKVWMVALTIMTVASIETLLCIEAVDKLDPQKRTTSANVELKAQGIGNMISGLLGGLPLTSVIVRSSANLNAGAKTKMSAIIHGLLILVCSAFIPMLLNKIPLASLAAILLMTGYKLAKISVFKEMFAKSKYQWMPFIITVLVVVFTDLLTGVLVGLAVSIFAILRGNIKNTYFFHKQEHKEGETIYIHLSEEVSFLNKAAIKLTLEHLPENSTVVIDASHCHYIDHDVIELIKEFTSEKSKLKKIDCKTIGFLSDYAIENSSNIKSFTTNKLEHRETILKQFQTTN